ncbi:non-ribosomal peptide synthetase, partial [Paenibacillus elgii]|uniref:non-ribosomal peptide synthetase n=1 Tax=Paenibacillus elgii TaxID=189691 RepID=UPI000248D9B0
ATFDLRGSFDREVFEKSLGTLVNRYQIFRTNFHSGWEEPLQVVFRSKQAGFYFEDLRQMNEAQREAYITAFTKKDKEKGFDLAQDALMRISILRTGEEAYRFIWSFHHIVMDGWCLALVTQEVFQTYFVLLEQRQPELAPVTPYSRYIEWLEQQDSEEASKYWSDYLAGYEQQTLLPTDKRQNKAEGYAAEELTCRVDQELTGRMKRVAREYHVTIHTLLQTAWGIVLQTYNGNKDVVFGSVVSGRPAEIPGIDKMIGLFINTIPVRIRREANATFAEVMRWNQEQALASRAYDTYPLYDIQELTEQKQDLINHIMVFENYPVEQQVGQLGSHGQASFTIANVEIAEQTNYDFNLIVMPGEEIQICFRYNAHVYDQTSVERIQGHLIHVMEQVVDNPYICVNDLELVTAAEKAQIVEAFNDTAADYPRDKTIHQLFEEQVERTPNQVAVVYEESQLTYRELNEKANRLARTLRAEGVQPDQPVGIMVERSLEMIVGIFGILKAGGAYVPIDPEYPGERIGYMLEDSGAKVLLTQRHLQERVSFAGELVRLDDEQIYSEDGSNLEPGAEPNHLAYVIYTSGTTGKPKGVMVEHHGLCNLKLMFEKTLKIGEQDNVVQFASLSFDASCWEIFKALFKGATLYIPTAETILDYRLFENYMSRHQITAAILPPTYAAYLNRGNLPSMKKLITGGSACSVDFVQQWQDSVLYFNAYGPTEDSIVTTIWSASATATAGKLVPIGRPLPNHRIYIVDANDQLLPVGIAGELCISGIGLARGYLNRPELTAEKFVNNPFAVGERMYRTGDLARWLPDGNIEYLGRIDDQVKIRGYRIELGEIETQLVKVATVQEAVVMAREDKIGQKVLCAYLVADKELTVGELRSALSKELPGYMVPSYFVQLAQMPLTPNGKIDRKALPAPEGAIQTGVEYVAPRTRVEAQLEQIWKDVLGPQSISVKDNFFDIGGHSLRATTLVTKMHKEMGIGMPLREVFQYPTIEQMAEVITGREQNAYASIPIIEESAYYPVSSAQKRLYILSQLEGGELSYNIPGVMTVEGALDRERLEEAFRQLIRRHETLRTGFELVDGEPVQRIHPEVEFAVEYMQVREGGEIREELLRGFVRVFDLRQAPLLRVGLIELKPDRHLLLFDMHHIISDGTSIGILIEEFVQLYEGAELSSLRIQYKDYAAWQQAEVQSERMSRQEAYWLDVFSGEIPVLDLPTDYARPAVRSFKGSTFEFVIGEQRREGLRQLAAQTGSTLYMVLLAAYTTLLAKYSGQEDVIVGTPIAGRPHADLGSMIGMFVGTLALRNYPSGEKTFDEYVQEVKEHALKAYENQDYPFEELVEKLSVKRDVSRNPLFDTMFVLQNTEQGELNIEGLKFKRYPNEHTVSKFDLTLNAMEEAEGITCSIEYASSLYKPESVERMAQHFTQLIDVIVNDPQTKLSAIEIITPQEKAKILGVFNDTAADYPREKTIHQLFEEQAERTPEQVAVVFENEQLTYRELNERANQLARTLGAEGLQTGQPVGLMVERSLEMIAGILGILKAGGAYVPIDPDYPEDRIRYILEDSGARLLLAQNHLRERVCFTGKLMVLDDEQTYNKDGSNLELVMEANDLAYVIYTSGSTGKPKGVQIEHRSVVNFMEGITARIDFSCGKTILSVTTISFDIFVLETLLPLSKGVKVVLANGVQQTDPVALSELIVSQQVDMIQMTPSRMQLLQSSEHAQCMAGLSEIMIGGETFTGSLLESLHKSTKARLYNMYGPTETTIWSSVAEITEADKITLGKPICNTQCYIMNAAGQLQPIGAAGEFCIGGEGLARGYLNRTELTSEKFVDNPFATGERMYRTGDLARWLPDGSIEYLGRIDHQVKIRGYRIELGEIETQLVKVATVQEAVVMAREDEIGQKVLCAYFVADKELTVGELRSALSKDLPGYMVPSYFVQLVQMPLTPNGKIDRKALPAPEGSMQTGVEYVAPRTKMEAQLAKIWQEVLGLQRIGVKDNFFDIGGHSLKALQLTQKIHTEMEMDIPLRVVFEIPFIEEMADELLKRNFNKFEQKNGSNIIQLNENGLTNIFCFPPVLGYGIAFAEMAKHLENHCVVYAIDFIEDNDAHADMLDSYVDSIISIQEKAPYVFLGYSAGGNLAFEVAKVMEKRGYEVSDIIMIDSMKKNNQIKDSPEEIDNLIDEVLEGISEPYKQILNAPVTRNKVRNKMHAYHTYLNEIVNTGFVQASIHGLIAEGSEIGRATNNNVLLWKQATQKRYVEYEVIGRHLDLLLPGFVEENAKVIQRLVQEIFAQTLSVV